MSVEIIVNRTERKVEIEVNRAGIKGDTGKTAYQSYLDTTTDNPVLTEAEWSERAKGDDGKSAYEVAVENGYVGSETDWLASLKGADGQDGAKGDDGDSAYQVWLDAGNTGSVQDYLDSLKGDAFTYDDFTPQQIEDLKARAIMTQDDYDALPVKENKIYYTY